jgi:hypothetical protein
MSGFHQFDNKNAVSDNKSFKFDKKLQEIDNKCAAMWQRVFDYIRFSDKWGPSCH